MNVVEKAGQRWAVMDNLRNPKTGLPIEVVVHTQAQEDSMRKAGRLGEHLASNLMRIFSNESKTSDTCGETRRI